MMNEKVIKAAILEDHELFRKGFCALLKPQKKLSIVTETGDPGELVKALNQKHHDILFIDIMLKEENGMALTPLLLKRFPKLKIIVLSGLEDGYYVQKMIEAGAVGYFTKNVNIPELVSGVGKIMDGETFICAEAAKSYSLFSLYKSNLPQSGSFRRERSLTLREKEIADMIMTGLTNRQMSERLNLSVRTIETHRTNILQKLGAKNTVEMVKIVNRLQNYGQHN